MLHRQPFVTAPVEVSMHPPLEIGGERPAVDVGISQNGSCVKSEAVSLARELVGHLLVRNDKTLRYFWMGQNL